jgi:hypothetical protein
VEDPVIPGTVFVNEDQKCVVGSDPYDDRVQSVSLCSGELCGAVISSCGTAAFGLVLEGPRSSHDQPAFLGFI